MWHIFVISVKEEFCILRLSPKMFYNIDQMIVLIKANL